MNKFTIATMLITFMFFISGIDKMMNVQKVADGLQKRVGWGVPANVFVAAIVFAALLEITAPLIMTYSAATHKYSKEARWAAVALALFTALVTYVYHFPPFGTTYYPFISNVTTFGALLLLAQLFRCRNNENPLMQ